MTYECFTCHEKFRTHNEMDRHALTVSRATGKRHHAHDYIDVFLKEWDKDYA